MLGSVFRFLSVEENFQPDITNQYNIGLKSPQNTFFLWMLEKIPISFRSKLRSVLPAPVFSQYMKYRSGVHKENLTPSVCPKEAKEFLYPIFKPHILRLKDLIGRDLSFWLD